MTSELADFLERVVNVCFGNQCSVTSWIRTPKRNESKGGKPASHHLTGFAVDIVPDSWPAITPELMSALTSAKLHYLVESDHIHVQNFPAQTRTTQA